MSVPEQPTLRDIIDERYRAHAEEHRIHERAHEREHVTTELAIKTATTTLDKRLDGMNEFRDQLRDQAATFVTRDSFTGSIAALRQEIATEREARKELSGSLNTWRWLAGFLGLSGIGALLWALNMMQTVQATVP